MRDMLLILNIHVCSAGASLCSWHGTERVHVLILIYLYLDMSSLVSPVLCTFR